MKTLNGRKSTPPVHTHAPDVVELDADDHGAGGDTIYKIKVPTPLKQNRAAPAGVGTRAHWERRSPRHATTHTGPTPRVETVHAH
jgi:hypothetical protein